MKIRMIAIKYLWICPNCQAEHKEDEPKQAVCCDKCGERYQVHTVVGNR